jgi:tetratricopeptide (TPR) repeat protein
MAKKARELAPNDPRGTEIMGKIAFATNDFVQAYNLLVQVVASGTDDAAAAGDLQDYAWAAYSQGKIDEARGAMERIVKAAPPTAAEAQDAQSFLALTDADPGASTVSDANLTKTLQTTPNYVPALIVRAERRLKQGDAQGAAADCLAALQRFPDFPLAQKTLAGAYLRDPQNQAKAYDLAVKAHNALPDDAEASNLLAAASYERKDYSYAASLLQQSAAKGPLDAESLYYLGMSLSQLKEKPASREALKLAIAGGLAEPDLSEAKRVLAGPAK